jgi:CBS domain-containing protein
MLRSALWARSGDFAAATHRATRVGGVLATGIIAVGLVETLTGSYEGIWLAVIGWFILEAGRAEEQRADTRDALAGVTVEMLMTRSPVTVGASQTLAEVAEAIARTAPHSTYPVVDDGVVIGLFPLKALTRTGGQALRSRAVRDFVASGGRVPAFSPGTPAIEALDELVTSRAGRGIVLEDDRLVGIISATDLVRALALGRPV